MPDSFESRKAALKTALRSDESFDIIERNLIIGGKRAVIFYINGLVKDEIMEKILEFFFRSAVPEQMKNANAFSERCVPYVEIGIVNSVKDTVLTVLSGLPCLLADWDEDRMSSKDPSAPADASSSAKASGSQKSGRQESGVPPEVEVISFDMRSYPQRSSGEAEDDKVLRGSKDGFLETVIFNLALIRRRIRTPDFISKAFTVGDLSKSDVIVCYMDNLVDHQLLDKITRKIETLRVDSLRMNQQTLIEALVGHRWLNPFPKVKYTERPDVASAVCLKGNIVILVDNSPSALLIPTSIFDVLDEADDYYFPPVTGTYIRLSRYIISLISVLLTPLWLLALQNPSLVPETFRFITVIEPPNIPVFWQLVIMELCIDGLRLASLHTPSSLTSALGIIGGIAFSQFAIDAGWFSTPASLYMAFVTIANYSLPNFELGYSLKFIRMGLLALTYLCNVIGFIAGIILIFLLLLTNKTISGKSFLYPIIPLNPSALKQTFARFRK